MNILFLNNGTIERIDSHNLYTDLIRALKNLGANLYVVGSVEKKYNKQTFNYVDKEVNCVMVRTGNTTKCNLVEKFISIVTLPRKYIAAIKKVFKDVRFDAVIYPTPPITFYRIVRFIKKRDNAFCYLLLKDIFPQNAVDIGILRKTGIKGVVYRRFRRIERSLYNVSDKIGCMSPANVTYLLKHNPYIDKKRVETFPNCIEPHKILLSDHEAFIIRRKYGVPVDKTVFVYGGNLGKPQGIPFVIDCLRSLKNDSRVFFLVVGGGTEFNRLQSFKQNEGMTNLLLLRSLPKEEYEKMIAACDVGLVFLDHRFTIPNFPSRLLSYLQARLPIFACTDTSTDIGSIIQKEKIGWWCESNRIDSFKQIVNTILMSDLDEMKDRSYNLLIRNYDVRNHAKRIIEHLGCVRTK